jgi:ferredoxin
LARRIFIEDDECIGCEGCVELCPDIFRFNEERGKSEVVRLGTAPMEMIEEAIESCPSQCIHWD